MKPKRPGALTALAIIAFILGGLIFLSSMGQLVNLLFQDYMFELNRMSSQQPGMPPEMAERMQGMYDEMYELQRSYNLVFFITTPITILFSAFLIFSGIRALTIHPQGRHLFAYACAIGIFVEIGREIAPMMMTWESIQITSRFMGSMPGPNAAQMQEFMGSFMSAVSWLSIAFMVVWVLVKASYFVWGLMYMTKPDTKALFESATDR